MADQQGDLALRAGEKRAWQIGLADRRPGHRGGVDGVALAAGALGLARAGHHVRRHPDHRLPGAEQKTLERAGDVAAVLDCPDALLAVTAGEVE